MKLTALYVAYGVDRLDLSWLPPSASVIVVHNDGLLDENACIHNGIRHLYPESNLGFGAGVNLGLEMVETDRVILCNPDTCLTGAHYQALARADPLEIVTVPLATEDGIPNAVVNPYWSLPAFLATALRLGRFAPRGGRLLPVVNRFMGRWGRGHAESLQNNGGSWSLRDRWACGAVLSIDTELLRSVGGFDDSYFLYYEDADLHQRLSRHEPRLCIRLADVAAARHDVGGSATDPDTRKIVEGHRRRSAAVYASRQDGLAWRGAARLVGALAR